MIYFIFDRRTITWKRFVGTELSKLCLISIDRPRFWLFYSTLPMRKLPLSKAQERKDVLKPSKSNHVGTHWIAVAEHSQISTHLPGFQSFLHHFVFTKVSTSCIRVNAFLFKISEYVYRKR